MIALGLTDQGTKDGPMPRVQIAENPSGRAPGVGIVRIDAPERSCSKTFRDFFTHKGWPWVDDIVAVVSGDFGGNLSETFHLAEHQGRPIASVWVTQPPARPGVGCLGHVYTDPAWRRRGLAGTLMEFAIQDFRRRGGATLLLGTDNPAAARLYERQGFRLVRGNLDAGDNCVMILGPSPRESRDLTEGDIPAVRRATRSDLAELIAFYSLQYGGPSPLNWALNMEYFGKAEEAFVRGFQHSIDGRCLTYAVEAGGSIVGAACFVADDDGDVLFDYALPGPMQSQMGELLDEILTEGDVGGDYIVGTAFSDERAAHLESAGFKPSGIVERRLRDGSLRTGVRLVRRANPHLEH